jgi:hypothetical protein
VAKRLQLNFAKPVKSEIDENGQPRPCAMGREWVNDDTMKTLAKRHIPRTDAKGNPLPAPAAD